MTGPFAPTAIGRLVDLMAPRIEPAHLLSEIAPGLSHLARFAGQTATPYSVAQHSVLMAEAAESETGDPTLAAYCLLHDAHKAYLGETPTPARRAVEAEMIRRAEANGTPDVIVEAQIARWRAHRLCIEDRLDAEIHRAAQLPPIDDRARALVKLYDMRALATEKRDLHSLSPAWPGLPADVKPLPLREGKIRPWRAPGIAYDRFATALARLCPDAVARAHRLTEGDAA